MDSACAGRISGEGGPGNALCRAKSLAWALFWRPNSCRCTKQDQTAAFRRSPRRAGSSSRAPNGLRSVAKRASVQRTSLRTEGFEGIPAGRRCSGPGPLPLLRRIRGQEAPRRLVCRGGHSDGPRRVYAARSWPRYEVCRGHLWANSPKMLLSLRGQAGKSGWNPPP